MNKDKNIERIRKQLRYQVLAAQFNARIAALRIASQYVG